jgi:hypothetical protein
MNSPAFQELKRAVIAILIGVAVTLVTQIAAALGDWLKALSPEAIGAAVAAGRYAYWRV